MRILSHNQKRNQPATFALRSMAFALIISLIFCQPLSFAQQASVLGLPKPGTMINLSSSYVPVIVKGLRVHPENPILFDFIVDTGNSGLVANSTQLRFESEKLIKYFLASLTIPEDDLWVNLSPYEKNRIIPEQLGQTVMGRDMLTQDYILKQLTASLIYPEKDLGKEFWNKVYTKAQNLFGSSNIPVNTFNKVWILADKAKVYVHDNTAFVVACHMKVMLEEDYLSLSKHAPVIAASSDVAKAGIKSTNAFGSQIVREVILPELEKEVNEGKNFANLRQIYNSMILAVWYKRNLKEALLNKVYANKTKINGINVFDRNIREKIYRQYLEAYKKGVFNYIKEDADPDGQIIPRKYFSGGLIFDFSQLVQTTDASDAAMAIGQGRAGEFVDVRTTTPDSHDAAMIGNGELKHIFYTPYIDRFGPNAQNVKDYLESSGRTDDLDSFNNELNQAIEWVRNNARTALLGTRHYNIGEVDVKVLNIQERGAQAKINYTRLKNELRGFYYQPGKNNRGTLYVLKESLEQALESAKKTNPDILGAYMVMAFAPFIPLDEQSLEDNLDDMAKLQIQKTGAEELDSKMNEIIQDLRQRRHKENLLRAYRAAFTYLKRRSGPMALQATMLEDDLIRERGKIIADFPGRYELHDLEQMFASHNIQFLDDNEVSAEEREFSGLLTDEASTLINYTLYGRALNLLAGTIQQGGHINETPEDHNDPNRDYSKGQKIHYLMLGAAYNPETIAHLLIMLEPMMYTDGAEALITNGDFRKPGLSLSALLRQAMVRAVHATMFGGNTFTSINTMSEPPVGQNETELNAEEKIRERVVAYNPRVDDLTIEYEAGVDHYKGIVRYVGLTEENLKDFVYYMAISEYVHLMEELIKPEYGQHQYVAGITSLIDFIRQTVGQEADYEKRKDMLEAALLARIKARERIQAPQLDTVPKIILIKEQLKVDNKPVHLNLVIPLRKGKGAEFVADHFRDSIIEKYGLKVDILGGITTEISSTLLRQALADYVSRGRVNRFKLAALPLTEWPYIFGQDAQSKQYRHFLIRYSKAKLPGDVNELEDRHLGTPDTHHKDELEKSLNELGQEAGLGPFSVRDTQIILNQSTFRVINGPPTRPDPENNFIEVGYQVINRLNDETGQDENELDPFNIHYSSPNYRAALGQTNREKIERMIRHYVEQLNKINANPKSQANPAMRTAQLQTDEEGNPIANPDKAMNFSPTGGIDLNAKNLQMDINGEPINLKFDPSMMAQFQRGDFSGVVPVIIQITPIQNPLPLLGINPGKEEEALTKV